MPDDTAPIANASRCRKLWNSRLLRLLICFLGGVVMALAFLPYDISVLVWIGLLPLLCVLWTGKKSFWAGFGYGWFYGMGWYCVSFSWIREVGEVFGINDWVFLGIAFIPLMTYYALLPALWAGVAARFLRPNFPDAPQLPAQSKLEEKRSAWKEWATLDMLATLRSAVGLGAFWVVIEWLRAHGTLAFSWNSMGMALYDGLSLAQWAEFVGTSALSFLPVFVGIIIWAAMRRCYIHSKAVGKPCRPWDFYAAILLLIGLFMGGLSLSQRYSDRQMLQRKDSVIALPVLAVQNNLGQVKKKSLPIFQRMPFLDEYLSETAEAYVNIQRETVQRAMQSEEYGITQQLPIWVIWPESALPFHLWRNLADNTLRADRLSNKLFSPNEGGLATLRQVISEMGGAPMVLFTGVDEVLYKQEGRSMVPEGMYNSMAIIEDGFESIQTRSKQHLMPFGEYIPLARDIKWIGEAYSKITGTQTGDGIRPGSGTDPIPITLPNDMGKVSVIPAICYEDTVSQHLRPFVRPEAQVIVNISNDAWFQHSACGEQQARNAAFRCIELRRPMIRAANQGLSCAIAPNGSMLHELRNEKGEPWTKGYSYAVLPVDTEAGLTFYAQFGDWAVVLCLLIAMVLAIPSLIRRK